MKCTLLVLGLLACVALSPNAGSAADVKDLKIQARGAWPHMTVYSPAGSPRELKQWVFREEKELAEVAGPHGVPTVAAALKVDGVDFKKQMLLAVFDGTQPLVGVSGGGAPSAPNRIEIRRVEVSDDGNTMTVRWRTAPRDPKDEIITAPLQAVLIDRFDGVVQFERDPVPSKDKSDPAQGKEIKATARASWPDGWKAEEPARQWFVRHYADLIDPRLEAPENVLERMRQAASDRYVKALKADAIHWDKQMVVGVSAGVQPNGGYKVEVTRVETDADGKRMTVYWTLRPPAKGEKFAPEPAHPAEVVLVEQFPGEVQFKEESAPKE